MTQDESQIQNVIESENTDTHPIKVEGEDICAIAEMLILCITNPLSKYSKAKIDSMLEKIAPTEVKKRKTARQLNLIFANYVKKNCYCCYIHI